MEATIESQNQKIELPLLKKKEVSLFIKREDAIHPNISGNKYRKLKYNLIAARNQNHKTLLTFGGAYSNHVLATACAGNENGFHTIGVIRGNELKHSWQDNPTLHKAHSFGMRFHFVDRETYRNKEDSAFIAMLNTKFGKFYLLPEGGTNILAIKGCEEILTAKDVDFDFICCSVGTGATVSGVINASKANQKVIGFSALKGDFIEKEVSNFTNKTNWQLEATFHFGGYAKVNGQLVNFINDFKKNTGVALDPIYTGKMMYGIIDYIKNDRFAPKSNILVIHTGGLQGIKGMNLVLNKKNLPSIL